MGQIIYFTNKRELVHMKKNISIFDVAKAFLTFESMTHKKLQKLCYYAQAIYIAISDNELFGEDFEAWVHGPVSPKLYKEYKNYGFFRISKEKKMPEKIAHNDKIRQFLEVIYRAYGRKDGDELENLTHREMPWINARRGLHYNENSSNKISKEDMKIYYRKILEV